MKTFSEMAGLIAGLSLLVGALLVIEPYVARDASVQTAALNN